MCYGGLDMKWNNLCLLLLFALLFISCARKSIEPITTEPQEITLSNSTTTGENPERIATFLSLDPSFSVMYTVQSNKEGIEEIAQIIKEGIRLRKEIRSSQGEARILRNEQGVTACYLISGNWACSEGTMPELEFEQKRASLSETFEQTKSRNLLGALATCFSGSKQGVAMEYCFSKEGIVLYAKITQGEYTTLYSATSISQNLSKVVWTVP